MRVRTLLFGFAAVEQDIRGTCKSEGNFTLWHSDGGDGMETLDWIVKQPWSNGEVYEIGASADGIASLMLAKQGPSQARPRRRAHVRARIPCPVPVPCARSRS